MSRRETILIIKRPPHSWMRGQCVLFINKWRVSISLPRTDRQTIAKTNDGLICFSWTWALISKLLWRCFGCCGGWRDSWGRVGGWLRNGWGMVEEWLEERKKGKKQASNNLIPSAYETFSPPLFFIFFSLGNGEPMSFGINTCAAAAADDCGFCLGSSDGNLCLNTTKTRKDVQVCLDCAKIPLSQFGHHLHANWHPVASSHLEAHIIVSLWLYFRRRRRT